MKKIKVALIEFDYHAEVLRNTLYILNQNAIEVAVFTSEKIWKEVGWIEPVYFHLHTSKNEVPFNKYLNEEIDSINKNDIVLFNTVASNFKVWNQVNITAVKLLRIHNSNTYLNKEVLKFDFKFSLFHFWKDTSHIIRKSIGELDWYYRNLFIKKMDGFVFPNEFTMDYASDEFDVPKSRSWSLPFGFVSEGNITTQTSVSVKIGIIGRVDQRYRDYESVVNAIQLLIPFLEKENIRLELVLLGSASSNYGQQICKKLDELKSDYFLPVNYMGFVPQEEFDNQIQSIDFLIIPTHIHTRYTIYKEYYGYTKISGSVNDVIKYKKPALISSKYPIERDLSSVLFSYEDSEGLSKTIEKWVESGQFSKLDFSVVNQVYSLKSLKNKYLNAFQAMLSKKN